MIASIGIIILVVTMSVQCTRTVNLLKALLAPLSEINISQDSERVAGPKQEQKLIILSEEKLQGGICSLRSELLRRLASICWN